MGSHCSEGAGMVGMGKVGPPPYLYFNDNAICQHIVLLGSDCVKVHTQNFINNNGNNEKNHA